jgi:HSP20 family protein
MEGDDAIRIEEYEEDGSLVVTAEAPGLDPDKEDVEITVVDQTLQIKTERRQQTKSEDKKGYCSEFRYGSFVRRIPLPAGATEAGVTALYVNGILEVRSPSTESRHRPGRSPYPGGDRFCRVVVAGLAVDHDRPDVRALRLC